MKAPRQEAPKPPKSSSRSPRERGVPWPVLKARIWGGQPGVGGGVVAGEGGDEVAVVEGDGAAVDGLGDLVGRLLGLGRVDQGAEVEVGELVGGVLHRQGVAHADGAHRREVDGEAVRTGTRHIRVVAVRGGWPYGEEGGGTERDGDRFADRVRLSSRGVAG